MTTDDNGRAAALERALIRHELETAAPLERARPASLGAVADAAAEALGFDFERDSLVRRDTGEPTTVRNWLRGQRAARAEAWAEVRGRGRRGR